MSPQVSLALGDLDPILITVNWARTSLPSPYSISVDSVVIAGFRGVQIAGRSGRVVIASDCGVRGPVFESHRGPLCLSRQQL